jgi:hypothetical protein
VTSWDARFEGDVPDANGTDLIVQLRLVRAGNAGPSRVVNIRASLYNIGDISNSERRRSLASELARVAKPYVLNAFGVLGPGEVFNIQLSANDARRCFNEHNGHGKFNVGDVAFTVDPGDD